MNSKKQSSSRPKVRASGPAPVFHRGVNGNVQPNGYANGHHNGYVNGQNAVNNGNVQLNGYDNGHHHGQQLNEAVSLEYGSGSDSMWKCAVCTYQNKEDGLKCSMCGLPRNDLGPKGNGNGNGGLGLKGNGNAQRKAEDEKWICTACTYSNWSWNGRCEICQAKRRLNGGAQPLQNKLPSKVESQQLHNEMSPVLGSLLPVRSLSRSLNLYRAFFLVSD